MTHALPPRPSLDHLRRQAKTLLARLHDGEASAVRSFQDHLPSARRLSAAQVRAAGFRLADAQSVIARETGCANWPLLARHVEQLRALEGEWTFVGLEVDGEAMPAAAFSQSKLLIDGDRFRMESVEGTYEGEFTVDVGEEPARIDIEFVDGPEAGNWSYGIYELDGDRLTICLALVGATRPVAFRTQAGSGHALERLRRATAARPRDVRGGVRPPADGAARRPAPAQEAGPQVDPATFDGPMTPMLMLLEGRWLPTALVTDGEPLREDWLAFGSRTVTGREVKVVFGGQVMVHAKVRVDESSSPIAIDYLLMSGKDRGKVSLGILEWTGDELTILMASAGLPRPADFAASRKGTTLSRWRRA